MPNTKPEPQRHTLIRALFDEYVALYTSRDERLIGHFSENFSGYAGSSDILVQSREDWIKVTRQDFAQIRGQIHFEMRDIALQDLSEDVVMVTAFFRIHLPIPDRILARETARLVLVFKLEAGAWKIVHSGISIPYHFVREGEVYPVVSLRERNRDLEALVEARTHELEEANRRFERLSNTDGLTGIANRRYFDLCLSQEWNCALCSGKPLSLIMIDVDRFKHYNDHYGHLAGDCALQAVAAAIAGVVRRAEETVARYGGEEFVVLLPGLDLAAAADVARRIQQAVWSIALPHAVTAPGILTISLGVASLVPRAGCAPETLVRQADQALFRSKQCGRNQMQMADPDLAPIA